MESQMHRTHYDDPLHATGTVEEEHGGETRSAMKKVKEKVEKLQDTVKHGHAKHDHGDEPHLLDDSPAVRSGLVEPTLVTTPVLAEDLYATHSDIVDPPVRSFAKWEEEEQHGDPPPLSTGTYGTHPEDLSQFGHQPYNQQHQSRDNIEKSAGQNKDHTDTYRVDRTNIEKSAGQNKDYTDKYRVDRTQYVTHPDDQSQFGHQSYSQHQSRGNFEKSTDVTKDPTDTYRVERTQYVTHPDDRSQFGHQSYSQHQSRDNIEKSTGVQKDLKDENRVDRSVYGTRPEDPSQFGHPSRDNIEKSTGAHKDLTDENRVDRSVYDRSVYGTHPEDPSQFGHQSRDNIEKSTGVDKDLTDANRADRSVYDRSVYGTHPEDPSQFGHPSRDNVEQSTGVNKVTTDASRVDRNEYGTRTEDPSQFGRVDRSVYDKERPTSGFGRSTGMEEDPNAPNTASVHPANYQTKVTDPTSGGGKEVGITGVLHSFDKMGIYDESHSKTAERDQEEQKQEVFTGSHDQFRPEPVESPPLDTIAADPSNKNSSYSQKIKSATSAVTDKATAAKDSIVSKLSSSGANKTDASNKSHEASTKPYSATDYAHVVADTLSGTIGPVYEKVSGAGSSVMSKMQGSGHEENVENVGSPGKGGTVKEYLVNTFMPGDDDKVLSEKITNVFHRGKGNVPMQEVATETTTTYVIKDEGERRLQEN